MGTSLVVDLYSNNTAGLAPRQIAEIYEEEFVKAQAKTKGASILLKPGVAWITAAILGIILVFRDILKDWGTSLLKAFGNALYTRLAGRRILRFLALRHYRQAIIERYRELRIPFRPNRPLRMRDVYVPLRLAGDAGLGRDRIDAFKALSTYRRMMIKGPPGSGKSMLLRRIVVDHAEGRLEGLPDRPIPILLDLHRLNDDNAISIEEQLTAELGRSNFPHAEMFIARNLERGSLMLLFDGLDEVSSSIRPAIAKKIVDFLGKYRRCRFLSTCRTAIYRDEFASCVEQTLEVDEFSDQQIRRFLSSWQSSMPLGKSVEQLIQTLADRPRIIALARNPLLLTIIAYLYSDTSFQLPHSRSEFYETSTDVLLNQWHQEHNKFKAREKRLVLQQISLQLQDGELGQDRRTADFTAVLASVRLILPELGLAAENVGGLLDEIVERSGLLLAIDGGERYSFAHLTLQEFFAAEALRDSPEAILARFRKDPDAWREVTRLWCGLHPDSTSVVREIQKFEPVTAFECLGDVQRIDPDFASSLVASFKELLGNSDDQGSIIEAFGSVASDTRERGNETFEFLSRALGSPRATRRLAAAEALSRTNLPRAARILADRAIEYADVRPALVRMGDLAVPALLDQVEKVTWRAALDDLVEIGTPNAATKIVPLLWHENHALAESAAWRLGSLLRREDIEDALKDFRLDFKIEGGNLPWVWAPFGEPGYSSLPFIAGRIAFLLSKSSAREGVELDRRLVIALCTEHTGNFDASGLLNPPPVSAAEDLMNELDIPTHGTVASLSESLSKVMDRLDRPARERLIERILQLAGAEHTLSTLILSLDDVTGSEVVRRLIRGPAPSRSDWLKIFDPIEYEFRSGWSFRSCLLIFACLSLATLVEIFLSSGLTAHSLVGWLAGGGVFGILFVWTALFVFVFTDDFQGDPGELEKYLGIVVLGLLAPVVTLAVVLAYIVNIFIPARPLKFDWVRAGLLFAYLLLGPWVGVLSGLPFAAIGYFVSIALSRRVSELVVWLFWAMVLGVGTALWMTGRRLHRAAQNPLKGLLGPLKGDLRGTKGAKTFLLRPLLRLWELLSVLRGYPSQASPE